MASLRVRAARVGALTGRETAGKRPRAAPARVRRAREGRGGARGRGGGAVASGFADRPSAALRSRSAASFALRAASAPPGGGGAGPSRATECGGGTGAPARAFTSPAADCASSSSLHSPASSSSAYVGLSSASRISPTAVPTAAFASRAFAATAESAPCSIFARAPSTRQPEPVANIFPASTARIRRPAS